ncbi:hypothetical protein KR054_008138 [Drosophila jambulina]|nr:hypothetical protein KR054_008138 [Drosophila jambulina]
MSNSNLSNAPRRLAPGAATPVTSRGLVASQATIPGPGAGVGTGNSPGVSSPVPAMLTARLTSANTVTSAVTTLEQHQQVLQHQVSPERSHQQPTSCPDSPIRRVSSSLKNSALDFASRFFNKCKAATFTVDGATYTIGE